MWVGGLKTSSVQVASSPLNTLVLKKARKERLHLRSALLCVCYKIFLVHKVRENNLVVLI